MELPDGEPDSGPWRPATPAEVPDLLGHPRVLAVDGRSGSGVGGPGLMIAANGY